MFAKRSSVIKSIYSGQQQFSYISTSRKKQCRKTSHARVDLKAISDYRTKCRFQNYKKQFIPNFTCQVVSQCVCDFSSHLINGPNKPERFSLAGLFIRVLCFRVRAGAYPKVEQLKSISSRGQAPASLTLRMIVKCLTISIPRCRHLRGASACFSRT